MLMHARDGSRPKDAGSHSNQRRPSERSARFDYNETKIQACIVTISPLLERVHLATEAQQATSYNNEVLSGCDRLLIQSQIDPPAEEAKRARHSWDSGCQRMYWIRNSTPLE